MPLRDASPFRRQLALAADDPFVLARLVISGLLVLASFVAILLSVTGAVPRAWLIVAAAWAVWGVVHGVFDLILEPLLEFLTRSVADVGLAVAELETLRLAPPRLTPGEDILVGLALADLHEHRLRDPGQAMAELRRLIDQYPKSHHVRHLRVTLANLRQQHVGDPITPERGA